MKALKIAEYILWHLKDKHNKNISNLRLQKYPVIKEVYYHYCINGALNIINVSKENPLKGYGMNAVNDMIDLLVETNLTLSDLCKLSIHEFDIVKELWDKRKEEPILTAFSFKKFLLDRKEKR